MPKGFMITKKRDAQAALMCGKAFQKLAAGFIPKIRAIKEESSRDMSNELSDLVACATNLGFAIELYLKALLTQLDLPVPQEHNLHNLYDSIPQAVREVIENVYDAALPDQVRQLHGRVSITLAKGLLEEPKWTQYDEMPLTLPDLLARSGDLFTSWRYIFEFSLPKDGSYQFHQFEYGLLWCAAEAIRIEITVRLGGTDEVPPPIPLAGGS